jgi:hypothetical protein
LDIAYLFYYIAFSILLMFCSTGFNYYLGGIGVLGSGYMTLSVSISWVIISSSLSFTGDFTSARGM